MKGVPLILFFLVLLSPFVTATIHNHQYDSGEDVILWVNNVGPYHNPHETFHFYTLPFCPPDQVIAAPKGLGDSLLGFELLQSPLKFPFKKNIQTTKICSKQLSKSELNEFKEAIIEQYWYQLFLDDLPIWGMVGESMSNDEKQYIYSHQSFSISYNGDKIIHVNLTVENPVLLVNNLQIIYTYSVTWSPTTIDFDDRFHKYLDKSFFEHEIHWFSVINSLIMVVFLIGVVATILLKTLRRESSSKYAEDPEETDDDSGWKLVHGDVFRAPKQLILLAALVGTGYQFIFLTFAVLLLAIYGHYYENRGYLASTFVFGYCLTSFISGYASGSCYTRNFGKNWIKTMLLTAALFPGISVVFIIILNMIAAYHHSLVYISLTTIIYLATLWVIICFPFTVAGTLIGRNWNARTEVPCRINNIPRHIPERKWYLKPWLNVLVGGILPFGSIFIELYFVLTSLWHHKIYYVFGFTLVTFVVMSTVIVCVTIILIFFLLNVEDYRWHWMSFLSAGSTAGYVFLYAAYYYYAKTKMTGFCQFSFYFGHALLLSLALFILCGSLGYLGASLFVRRIYRGIKVE